VNSCFVVGELMNCCDGVGDPVKHSNGNRGNRSVVVT
jgi:hypothetical protein